MGDATCHGCKHCLYSAPGGQQWATYPGAPEILMQPHSRCTALRIYVPMVLGQHGKWLGNEVPAGCPEYAQPGLFELQAPTAKSARPTGPTQASVPAAVRPAQQMGLFADAA
jgi:hypothetical protein